MLLGFVVCLLTSVLWASLLIALGGVLFSTWRDNVSFQLDRKTGIQLPTEESNPRAQLECHKPSSIPFNTIGQALSIRFLLYTFTILTCLLTYYYLLYPYSQDNRFSMTRVFF